MQQNQESPQNVDPEFSHTEAAQNPASDPVEKPSPPDPIIVSNKPGQINKKYGVIAALTFLLLEIISAAGATPLLIGVVLVGIAIAFIAKAVGIRSTWAHLVPCALFFVLVAMVQKSFATPLTVLFATTIFTFRRADSGAELLKKPESRNAEPEFSHPRGKQKPVHNPERSLPTSDGSPKSAHIEPGSEKPSSGGAISSCTGVVTFAERETKKSTSNTPSSGDRGRVMEVRTISKWSGMANKTINSHIVRFRVIVQDKADGISRQIPAEVSVDETDIYLQEGDTVTLVSRVAKNGAMYNSGIINYSGKFVMIPKPSNLVKAKQEFWPILFGICLFSLIAGLHPLLALLLFTVLALLYWLWVLLNGGYRMKKIKDQIAQLLKAEGSWSNRAYTDPHGIIEGSYLFSRGDKNPVEWVVFRMGMYDIDGNLLDRLVGAIPQASLATELRKGDTVKWLGNFTTGKICRPSRVKVLSLTQR